MPNYPDGWAIPGIAPVATRVRVIETGVIYESQNACARAIGGNSGNVNACLHGKAKRHKGYTFEFVGPEFKMPEPEFRYPFVPPFDKEDLPQLDAMHLRYGLDLWIESDARKRLLRILEEGL